MSAIVPPSDSKTEAAELGLKAIKKIKNAIPSQVRTFLIMAGLLLWVRVTVSAAAVLTVSASSLGVNNVPEKPIPFPQVRTLESGPSMQVWRRCSVHELGRHPFTEIVQDHVLREEVTRACGPRYRIEPHSFGLTHVRASILWGLDAPQWSGVAGRLDLGVWTSVSIGVGQRFGDQIPGVGTGDPGESRAQSDAGDLRDQHHIG